MHQSELRKHMLKGKRKRKNLRLNSWPPSESGRNLKRSRGSVGTKITEGQEAKIRPIRVVLDSHEVQGEVMKNTPKLKEAQDPVKSVYLAYDMSYNERQTQKEMVSIAKDKTVNDPNYDFKIRGPPWKLVEVKYKKKNKDSPLSRKQLQLQRPKKTTHANKTPSV